MTKNNDIEKIFNPIIQKTIFKQSEIINVEGENNQMHSKNSPSKLAQYYDGEIVDEPIYTDIDGVKFQLPDDAINYAFKYNRLNFGKQKPKSNSVYKLIFVLETKFGRFDAIVPKVRFIKKDGSFGRTVSYDRNKRLLPLTEIEEAVFSYYRENFVSSHHFGLLPILNRLYYPLSRIIDLDCPLYYVKGKETISFEKVKIKKITIDFSLIDKYSGLYWEIVLNITGENDVQSDSINSKNCQVTDKDVFIFDEKNNCLFYYCDDFSLPKILRSNLNLQVKFFELSKLKEILEQKKHPLISVNLSQKKLVSKYPIPKPLMRFSESNGVVSYNIEFYYEDEYVLDYLKNRSDIIVVKSKEDTNTLFIFHRAKDYENKVMLYAQQVFLTVPNAYLDYPYNIPKYNGKLSDVLSEIGISLINDGFEIAVKNSKVKKGSKGQIEIIISSGIDWFDVDVKYRDDDGTSKPIEIDKELLVDLLLKSGDDYIILNKDNQRKLNNLINAGLDSKGKMKVSKYNFLVINQLYEELQKNAPKELTNAKKLASKFESYDKIEELPLPKGFRGKLRPYQQAGFNWLNFLNEYNVNGCLADDMGLGKTIQTLVFLQHLKEKELLGLTIIVAPVTTLRNWESEIYKFTPDIKVCLYHGPSRHIHLDYISEYDIILVSYNTLRIDLKKLKDLKFNYMILDESQYIKNPDTLTRKAVKIFQSKHRLVLTGTPLENNSIELWSQFDFLLPGLLGNKNSFIQNFALPIQNGTINNASKTLKKLIYPFMLRRKKKDVLDDLPDKNEIELFVEMGSAQEEIYNKHRDIYKTLIKKKMEAKGFRLDVNILSSLLRLRQFALFPQLVDKKQSGIESCKFEQLKELVDELISEDHKILIFSQFVKVLNIIMDKYIKPKNIPYCYIDGQVNADDRKIQIEKFQNDETTKLFLISLKSGAFGINLTAADYVIIFDPWWNPAVETQAIDRAHRIGQKNKVIAYKIYVKDTIEEKILQLQKQKRELYNDLITSEESFMKKLTQEDILNLLL